MVNVTVLYGSCYQIEPDLLAPNYSFYLKYALCVYLIVIAPLHVMLSVMVWPKVKTLIVVYCFNNTIILMRVILFFRD
jgi:hypothetical protein